MAEQSSSARHDGERHYGRVGNRPYGMLVFSIGVRAAHQVGAAVFLTVYLLDLGGGASWFYTLLVMVSGGLLVGTEWLRHRQLYREVAGIVTICKCLLLGGAMHGLLPEMEVVLLVFLVASMGAHAPKQVRHRLLL